MIPQQDAPIRLSFIVTASYDEPPTAESLTWYSEQIRDALNAADCAKAQDYKVVPVLQPDARKTLVERIRRSISTDGPEFVPCEACHGKDPYCRECGGVGEVLHPDENADPMELLRLALPALLASSGSSAIARRVEDARLKELAHEAANKCLSSLPGGMTAGWIINIGDRFVPHILEAIHASTSSETQEDRSAELARLREELAETNEALAACQSQAGGRERAAFEAGCHARPVLGYGWIFDAPSESQAKAAAEAYAAYEAQSSASPSAETPQPLVNCDDCLRDVPSTDKNSRCPECAAEWLKRDRETRGLPVETPGERKDAK